jgi:hypothetical protein
LAGSVAAPIVDDLALRSPVRGGRSWLIVCRGGRALEPAHEAAD